MAKHMALQVLSPRTSGHARAPDGLYTTDERSGLKGDCVMLNSLRLGDPRNRSVRSAVTVALAVGVSLVAPTGRLGAQLAPLKPAHLNPMIEKLAAEQAVFGPIISD